MRLRSSVLLSLMVLLAGVSAWAQEVPPAQPAAPRSPQEALSRVEQLLETVRELRQTGRTDEADRMLAEMQHGLEGMVQSNPRSLDAHVLLGDVLTEAGDLNAARTEYKAVLQEDPSNFRGNLGLGRFYVGSRLWRQAALYLENASRVSPPDRRAEVLQLLAQAYIGQGRRTEAISAAERATAADPESIDPLRLLISVFLDAEQFQEAVDRSDTLLEVATRRRQADPAGRMALEDLIMACQIKLQALQFYYRSLCGRDVRGRYTDQLRAGTEVEAIEVLSEIAYLSEEASKLNWELTYHQTLALLEPTVKFQTEPAQRIFENNTRYLLDLAGLYVATHQDERAIEVFRRILDIPDPTDADPATARRNQELARDYLRRANVPPTSQPAGATSQPVVPATQPAAGSQP